MRQLCQAVVLLVRDFQAMQTFSAHAPNFGCMLVGSCAVSPAVPQPPLPSHLFLAPGSSSQIEFRGCGAVYLCPSFLRYWLPGFSFPWASDLVHFSLISCPMHLSSPLPRGKCGRTLQGPSPVGPTLGKLSMVITEIQFLLCSLRVLSEGWGGVEEYEKNQGSKGSDGVM